MRRSYEDHEWADEVVRRWHRRRWKVQQRDKAVADLKVALSDVIFPILDAMNGHYRETVIFLGLILFVLFCGTVWLWAPGPV